MITGIKWRLGLNVLMLITRVFLNFSLHWQTIYEKVDQVTLDLDTYRTGVDSRRNECCDFLVKSFRSITYFKASDGAICSPHELLHPYNLEIQKQINRLGSCWIQEQEPRKDLTYLAKLKGLGCLNWGKLNKQRGAVALCHYHASQWPGDFRWDGEGVPAKATTKSTWIFQASPIIGQESRYFF